MGFFGPELRAEVRSNSGARAATAKPARNVHIPINAMRELACKACPQRDSKARNPRMEPTGPNTADVLVLWGQPSEDDDARGELARGRAGDVVRDYLKAHGLRARHASTVRCHMDSKPGLQETECCRGFAVEEVKRTQPKIILGIGDEALAWATGHSAGNALTFRGRTFPVTIGGHTCWFFCLAYPHFAHKKNSRRRSEHEIALDHDLAAVKHLLERGPEPVVCVAPYDKGIEQITGQEPGDMQRLEDALNWAAVQPLVGVDYETNGLRPYIKDPLIYTAAVGTFDRTFAFCVDDPRGWGTDNRMRQVRGLLGEFLLFSNRKVVHESGFELEWSEFFYGPRVLFQTQWEDTLMQAYVLDGRPGTKGLGVQTLMHFGFNVKAQSTVDVRDFLRYPLPDCLRYNGMDTKWTHRLHGVNEPLLRADGLQEIYESRMRLAPVLVAAQAKGVPIDQKFADDYDRELAAVAREVSDKIQRTPEVRTYEQRFGRFSPTNTDHVLKLLKDVCKRSEIEREERDGTVRFTTDEEAMDLIPADEVPSAPLILRHRAVEKIRGTYVEPIVLGKWLSPHDDRCHTRYSGSVTVTGRLNSDDPNLQNIPIRTPEGRRVRHAIYAAHAQWIAALDYGQIEARVIGMASEDETLMRYQWTDYDIHGFWATRFVERYSKIKDWVVRTFQVDWDEKGHKTLRQEAKNKWVFPMFFGSAPHSCAAALHMPEDIADELAGEFWDEFPGVKRWQTALLRFYEKHLYVETLDGFRRRGPMSLNEIINMPVQGTAARIVTAAMTELGELAFETDDVELQSNLNIHDDLTHWLGDRTLDAKILQIARIMCRPRFKWITVPIIVECKVGARWDEMQEVAVYRSDKLYNLRNPFTDERRK